MLQPLMFPQVTHQPLATLAATLRLVTTRLHQPTTTLLRPSRDIHPMGTREVRQLATPTGLLQGPLGVT